MILIITEKYLKIINQKEKNYENFKFFKEKELYIFRTFIINFIKFKNTKKILN